MSSACRRPSRYTLDLLHPNPSGGASGAGITGGSGGEAWLHIDDEMTSSVRHEDVFGHGSGKGEERSDDRCAYLLFYQQGAFAQT